MKSLSAWARDLRDAQRERLRQEGRQEGRKEERMRIINRLPDDLRQEVERILEDDKD